MKMFILVIVIATVIGGFVGGEIMDKTFSILGATIGGVGLTTILLGLGAYFTAQEEKKRKQQLPPEIRGVFDRMKMGSDSISFACGQTESAVTLGRKEKWGKVRFRLYVAPEIESDPVFFNAFSVTITRREKAIIDMSAVLNAPTPSRPRRN